MITVTPFNPSAVERTDDDLLADAIEADGRAMLGGGVTVPLSRYLALVDGERRRAVPLDAAIDVALRSIAQRSGRTRPNASDADQLCADHPSLRNRILDALELDGGLVATSRVRGAAQPRPMTGLPRDFGPLMPDGRSRYTLNRVIGSGSTGTVYSAIDRHLSEPDSPAEVAIKLLTPLSSSPLLASRLTEEATKARRIDHPRVVRVHDRGGEVLGQPYIVYELVRGGDLDGLLEKQRGRLPVRRAVELCAQMARGVHAAHAAGLVHSDIKPANVLIDDEGGVKIADFGIAARLSRSMARDGTQGESGGTGGGPVGNLAFIAPEQFRGEPGCFAAPADIYAIGGVLYFLLTGAYPNGSSVTEVAGRMGAASAGGVGPSPSASGVRVEPTLDRVCVRALAPLPQDRHASAGELADDLEAWLADRPIWWQRPSPVRVVGLWVRRRPALALTGLVAAASLVGGVVAVSLYAAKLKQQNIELTDSQNKVMARNQQLEKIVSILDEVEQDLIRNKPANDPKADRAMDSFLKLRPNAVTGGEGRAGASPVQPVPPPR